MPADPSHDTQKQYRIRALVVLYMIPAPRTSADHPPLGVRVVERYLSHSLVADPSQDPQNLHSPHALAELDATPPALRTSPSHSPPAGEHPPHSLAVPDVFPPTPTPRTGFPPLGVRVVERYSPHLLVADSSQDPQNLHSHHALAELDATPPALRTSPSHGLPAREYSPHALAVPDVFPPTPKIGFPPLGTPVGKLD
ncbi:hypothetical protein Q9L58_004495 [Maublancomyces gigas]|uniref:Uncharacterized protein n=1 Tax=Discina gigas TaxID=1032678 RepID=A0ABR3GKY0_9PEZI